MDNDMMDHEDALEQETRDAMHAAWRRDARTAELCWKGIKICTGIIVALGIGSAYVELALKLHWPLPLP